MASSSGSIIARRGAAARGGIKAYKRQQRRSSIAAWRVWRRHIQHLFVVL